MRRGRVKSTRSSRIIAAVSGAGPTTVCTASSEATMAIRGIPAGGAFDPWKSVCRKAMATRRSCLLFLKTGEARCGLARKAGSIADSRTESRTAAPQRTACRATGFGAFSRTIWSSFGPEHSVAYAGTFGGLCRITSDRSAGRFVERIYTSADGLATNEVFSLFESSAGTRWAGAFGGLSELLPQALERFRALKTYTMVNGLSGPEIDSIVEDRNRNLWIGSADGAMKITQSGFSTFTAADGLTAMSNAASSVRVSSIFQDRSGALYVTNGARGREPFLSRLEGEQFKSIFPNLPAQVTSIGWGLHQVALQDHTGDWWIATSKGLVRFALPARFEQLAHARVKAIYTTSDGLPTDEVFRIFEDSRGDIWVATATHGLARWDRRTASFKRDAGFLDPKFGQFVTAFAEDRAGDVWIGLFTGGVVRFHHG